MTDAARLWRWCGEVYRRLGVAEACLRLQDECGADVNLALTLIWGGSEGISSIDAAALSKLLDISRNWQAQVVAPLRGVRRALKPDTAAATQALRTQVKTIELEAERIEQEMLAAALPTPSGSDRALASAAENLSLYLHNLTPVNSALPLASIILSAVFADATAEEIAAALAKEGRAPRR
ncbi:MAG: TIGR02444 family protein [Alphaproteobacteria bacterium]|nr:TIGR02444 family protein [Alphaproteobacteria bacterium]